MPNNKLSNLLSVIDSISLSETIVIVTKNSQQSAELNDFLKNKGINSIAIEEKKDIEIHPKDSQTILIITNDNISLLKESTISYVISLFSSTSLNELKEKANLCHLKEKLILIELISKFDFQFIQGLYKFSEIIIERFSFLENEKMLENKNARVLSFLKKAIESHSFLSSEYHLSPDINNFIQNCTLEDIKSLFISFLSLSVYSKFPTLDFVQSQTKNTKEFKIILSQGYLDSIIEESLKEYFLKITGITAENITQFMVDEKKSTIILKSKTLNKNDITSYIVNNTYLGKTLEVESINEKTIEEMGKFGESSSENYTVRHDKDENYQKIDKESHNSRGYQRRDNYSRREGSSGGYQRGDRDRRGKYQRHDSHNYSRRDKDENNTAGNSYPRRDNFSSRSSYNNGYDKFKNVNPSDVIHNSGYESKENEYKESKSHYYNKSNFKNNNNSSYTDKKPYRSFSNDFDSFDMQNSGKDRSGYDNKRKDFRGNNDRKASYGGGYKKPYERSSSHGSGYNNYSKDRYSKGSHFQSNKEESDSDNE